MSIAERAPSAFAKALGRFRGTNDPYVIERLAAAACGVVLRTDDVDASCQVADGVSELVADGWPEHLTTRDYVRRVFGVARARGWSGPDRPPPYGAQWPVPIRPFEEIEARRRPGLLSLLQMSGTYRVSATISVSCERGGNAAAPLYV